MLDTIPLSEASTKTYDAVIIPGGGLDPDTHAPNPWVRARLDAALQLSSQARYFITLSRGTTHRPPPLDDCGFPILESSASSKYLMTRGIACERILQDGWSLDTIGNAFFALRAHCDPMQLRRCIVITSRFHMERTRTIFSWVFGMTGGFDLDYCVTADVGMSAETVEARVTKEQHAVRTLREQTMREVDNLEKLAQFVFVNHGAYRAGGGGELVSESAKKTY